MNTLYDIFRYIKKSIQVRIKILMLCYNINIFVIDFSGKYIKIELLNYKIKFILKTYA